MFAAFNTLFTAKQPSTGALNYRAEVMLDSPVAYWRLGESTGITAADELGSNAATYLPNSGSAWTGGTLAQTGPVNGATSALFNGSSGYASPSTLSALAFIQNTAIFTIEFWIKNDDVTLRKAILGNTVSGSERGFFVIFENGAGAGTKAVRFAAFRGTAGQTVIDFRTADNAITDNNWHHVAVIHSAAAGGSANIYIDGVAQTIVSGAVFSSLSSGNSTRPLFIGSANNAGAVFAPMIGRLEEVAIYSTAVSSTRLNAHITAAPNP